VGGRAWTVGVRPGALMSELSESNGDGVVDEEIASALSLFPGGIYLMTSRFEDDRSGLRVLNAMPCSAEPVLLAVAA
jgi:flavin reductase (DIM6/NTAB) family NADH-FMN oxidoreductase RutF